MGDIFLHSNTKRKRKNLFSVLAEGRARSNELNWQQGLMYWAGDAVGLNAWGCGGGFQELVGQAAARSVISVLPWASRETR